MTSWLVGEGWPVKKPPDSRCGGGAGQYSQSSTGVRTVSRPRTAPIFPRPNVVAPKHTSHFTPPSSAQRLTLLDTYTSLTRFCIHNASPAKRPSYCPIADWRLSRMNQRANIGKRSWEKRSCPIGLATCRQLSMNRLFGRGHRRAPRLPSGKTCCSIRTPVSQSPHDVISRVPGLSCRQRRECEIWALATPFGASKRREAIRAGPHNGWAVGQQRGRLEMTMTPPFLCCHGHRRLAAAPSTSSRQ